MGNKQLAIVEQLPLIRQYFEEIYKDIDKYQNDYRVLLLAKGSNLNDISDVIPLGFVLIQDKIKENANITLDYFKSQGVDIKIISGDNPITVSKIAERAGITDIKSIDMSKVSDEEIPEIIRTHNVLGRVKPDQKKKKNRRRLR